ERLELQYGEDINNDRIVDVYRDADAVGDWRNVRAVTLAMLIRSPDDEGVMPAGATQTYNVLGQIVGPFADRRPRIVVSTTVAFRNLL
ncbi:MAG: PilW family protein, partial [Gammaproteobacteria bacterium]|nr:PilW family protein [Gammaproteobacteria bacterium]